MTTISKIRIFFEKISSVCKIKQPTRCIELLEGQHLVLISVFFTYLEKKKSKRSDTVLCQVDFYCNVELKMVKMVLLRILNIVHTKQFSAISYHQKLKFKSMLCQLQYWLLFTLWSDLQIRKEIYNEMQYFPLVN